MDAGPEVLTRVEAVRAIAAGIGKDIRFEELTEDEARQRWQEQGYDEESIDFFVQMAFQPPEVGHTVLPTVEQVLGRPARTLVQWAACSMALQPRARWWPASAPAC